MIWEIDEQSRAVEGLDEDGRARPEYAASLGLIPAPYGRRVLATAWEILVIALLQLPTFIVVVPAAIAVAAAPDPQAELAARDDLVWLIVAASISYALTTVFILVQLILHGRRGVTLGKALTGIRSVNVRTLERPKFWRGAVVRYLVLWGSFLVPVLGPLLIVALSPLFDPARRGRGWADLAAATWFVDIRGGLNPYDAKRMRIARKTVATDLVDERSSLPSLATAAGSAAGAYVPVARSSGGVLGAARGESAGAPAPSASPAGPIAPAVTAPPSSPAPSLASPAPAAAAAPAAVAPPAADFALAQPTAWAPPTLLPSVEPSAEPSAAPQSAAPQSAAPQRAAASGASSTPAASVSLVLDNGETIAVVGGGALLGRAPTVSPADAGMTPVAVRDETMSVSKTHLAVALRGDAAFATDRGSTNGSGIVRDGVEHPLPAGVEVPLADGDTIRFGDRSARVLLTR